MVDSGPVALQVGLKLRVLCQPHAAPIYPLHVSAQVVPGNEGDLLSSADFIVRGKVDAKIYKLGVNHHSPGRGSSEDGWD